MIELAHDCGGSMILISRLDQIRDDYDDSSKMSVYKWVWAPIWGNAWFAQFSHTHDSHCNWSACHFQILLFLVAWYRVFYHHPKFFPGIRNLPSPQVHLQKPGWSREQPRRLWSPTRDVHSFRSYYNTWGLILGDSPLSCHKLTIILLSLASLHLKTGVDQYSTIEVVVKVSNNHPGAISWPCIF